MRTPAPVPSGSLPANYPYAGRRFSAASRRRSTSSPAPCPSGYRTSPSKAGAAMGGGCSPRRQAWDAPVLGTQKAFPHGIPGPERPPAEGGMGRAHPNPPRCRTRHRKRGVAPVTAASSGAASPLRRPWCNRKAASTYGTAGAHIATVVPCTCTSMSMCTRGTPRTPGDRRSRSAPRAALDTSAKQPSHHSAGLVNREAPARRVIGSERPERRKARRTRNRPSGEDAFSARSFRRADRAVHHRGGIE